MDIFEYFREEFLQFILIFVLQLRFVSLYYFYPFFAGVTDVERSTLNPFYVLFCYILNQSIVLLLDGFVILQFRMESSQEMG